MSSPPHSSLDTHSSSMVSSPSLLPVPCKFVLVFFGMLCCFLVRFTVFEPLPSLVADVVCFIFLDSALAVFVDSFGSHSSLSCTTSFW
ncbi:hypothetical protein BDD12DRAFT_865137 [Trichophaea hybrida]|nr:hypothetical protein BDD12DRAFT_865137 [Trichophaea hybrida]